MMEALHRYGGYVAQSTGDGIFALFDAPVAHEDHPHRALHAALAMQEELRRYADRPRAEGKIAVKTRIPWDRNSLGSFRVADHRRIGDCKIQGRNCGSNTQNLANAG
jgi:class 3 adenylate cyclase